MKETVENVESIIEANGDKLIPILQDIQKRYKYLPEQALKIVSDKTNISLSEIYGVATFYKSFSLTPKGKHVVSVCLGTACHVRNAPSIANEFEKQLGIKSGETTKDKEFSFETVNCLGACALGPIVVVDGIYYSNVKTSEVCNIIEKTRSGAAEIDPNEDSRIFPIDVSCPNCNHSLKNPEQLIDNHPCIQLTVSFKNKHGWYRCSSLYGSYNFESEFEIPLDTKLDFFCPHCHVDLPGGSACLECGNPMISMAVKGGGIIQLCSSRGCKGHILDV